MKTTPDQGKVWEKTRQQNLLRHKSGRYYARLYDRGKEIWRSLKTSTFSVAEARLAALQKEHRERVAGPVATADEAKMTFSQAAAIHMASVEQDVSLKPNSKKYWRDTLAALLRSWPELASLPVRKITTAQCGAWAASYAGKTSASRFNNTIGLLRHIFDVARSKGLIYGNPAADLERVPVRAKRLELPTLARFSAFIAEMRRAKSRDSKNCADLAEGLAYTGCRIGEAINIEWRHVNFERGEILVIGDAETGTKNGEVRNVPLIPKALDLLRAMKASRPESKPSEQVFLLRECQKSMDRAAKIVGMERITHHDLRHFFATICIESGVDVPTVSRWLGHKDGGVLAMKTYGHLRREHSLAQAQKVTF